MTSLQTTTTCLGLGMAALILVLLRRDHLYLKHGLFWLLIAMGCVVLGIWPGIIDQVSVWLGIGYPPAGLLIGTAAVLFIKYLYADMVQTRLERQVRRLNQRIAMHELIDLPPMRTTHKSPKP